MKVSKTFLFPSIKKLHLSYNWTLSDTQGLFKKEMKTSYLHEFLQGKLKHSSNIQNSNKYCESQLREK